MGDFNFTDFFQSPENMFAVSSIASTVSGVFAEQSVGYGYEVSAELMEAKAQEAKLQAQLNALALSRKYNKQKAMDTAAYSIQGRSFSSGSIQNIMRQEQVNFNWDKAWLEKQGDIAAIGYGAEAMGYSSAASQAQSGAISKGLLGLSSDLYKYSQIG